MAIAGLSPSSPTLELAGRKGFFPLSLCLGNTYLASHWEAVTKGAEEAGVVADRGNWRVGRDIYIADTDKEARDKIINGFIGDHYREYWLPLMAAYGATGALKHDPDVADSDVTVEYVVEHCMCVGNPETVEQKIADIVESSGGFGRAGGFLIFQLATQDFTHRRHRQLRAELNITPAIPRRSVRDALIKMLRSPSP